MLVILPNMIKKIIILAGVLLAILAIYFFATNTANASTLPVTSSLR